MATVHGRLVIELKMKRWAPHFITALAYACACVSLFSDGAAFWLSDVGLKAVVRWGFRVSVKMVD